MSLVEHQRGRFVRMSELHHGWLVGSQAARAPWEETLMRPLGDADPGGGDCSDAVSLRLGRADWLVSIVAERGGRASAVMPITSVRGAVLDPMAAIVDRARSSITPAMDSGGGQKGTSSVARRGLLRASSTATP